MRGSVMCRSLGKVSTGWGPLSPHFYGGPMIILLNFCAGITIALLVVVAYRTIGDMLS